VTVVIRGVRNAFRNATRTIAIVLILGLAIGLAFVMLVAHRSVGAKVATTLSSVGNTVSIGPPGYAAGGRLGKFLTTAELAPIARLHGVAGVDESANGTLKASNLPKNAPKSSGGHRACARADGCRGLKIQGPTSLRYPGTMTFATQGLACEPAPCTPKPPIFFTIYVVGATEPTAPVNIGASTLKVVSGHAISGTSSAHGAMISTEMARKNGLKVGSTFTAWGKTFRVAAVFQSDSQQGNDTVVVSLPVVERLTGQTGQVFSAIVTVASLTQLSGVTSAIEQTLGPRASVVSNVSDADKAAGDLDGVKRIALYSLAGAVGAAAVILLLVMVLIVRERKREIGILKAIGASNGRIMAQFTTEAVTFTLLGWVVGVLAGIVVASPVTSALVSRSGVASATGARGLFGAPNPFLSHLNDINAQAGWAVVLEGLAAALVVAVVASAASTWMIGRIRPAEVLRSE
jgi:putative ABC transport system permease protein